MSATPLNFFDDEELLPLDNVLEFLKIAIDEGVKKIRITGGEPLLRKGLDEFIANGFKTQIKHGCDEKR